MSNTPSFFHPCNSKNSTYYAPTAGNATTALGSIAPPSTATAVADPTQWVPVSGAAYTSLANPASGYPVSGTSQIILSQCYANPDVSKAVLDFLTDHYTNASFASIVRGNGFNTVSSSFQTAIVENFLSNTSNDALDIDDSQLCGVAGGFAGR